MKIKISAVLLALALLIIIGVECCKTTEEKPVAIANAFVGNEQCKSCHTQEHAEWESSHHYMAMQPATEKVVSGNFDNASYTADGVTSRFFKKDGKFFINTEGEDGQNHDYEVKYIFGFTPLQQYLVEFPGGRMQVPRVSWDVIAKKWFHQYPGQKIPANDWIHWTGNGQNWNTMCASCHSTNVKKGYDAATDTYHTTYNDINVSCESCHGPGKQHLDYVNGDAFKQGEKTVGSLIQLYRESEQMAEVNTCGYCHARRSDIAEEVPVGEEVLQHYIPELPTIENFYADGQMREEDYNYTSFLQSKMFHRGVKCTNCHNAHSGKLKLDNALVCGQCHGQEKYATVEHTMHPTNLANVNCITCHMPSKIYMGNDLRHDHSFRVPRPDLSVKYGTPNTCNACHTNQTADWAAAKIAEHKGRQPAYHFSEDLIPASRLDEAGVANMKRLLSDTAIPGIVRAAATRYLGSMGQPASISLLMQQLKDSNALVRQTALRALRYYPYPSWLSAPLPLLADDAKAVRIAAADLVLDMPSNQIPPADFSRFTQAKAELDAFILFQTDFAQGNLQAGDYYRRQNNLPTALKYYQRAIAKDSQMVVARINLATVLNTTGQNKEALQQLLKSVAIQPNNDHALYTLGLLYAEMKQPEEAAKWLAKAIAVNKYNTRAMYNLALLMQQQGNAIGAEKLYRNALAINASNADVLYALTILYMQQGKQSQALITGKLLQQIQANNPDYAPLFQQLGLQ